MYAGPPSCRRWRSARPTTDSLSSCRSAHGFALPAAVPAVVVALVVVVCVVVAAFAGNIGFGIGLGTRAWTCSAVNTPFGPSSMRIMTPALAAVPPDSALMIWAVLSAITSSPRRQWTRIAI